MLSLINFIAELPSNIEILGQFCRSTDHRFWGESGSRYRNCEKISVFTEPINRIPPRTDNRYCGRTAPEMPQISGEPAADPICRLTGKRICPSNAAELEQNCGEPAAVPFTGIFYRESGKTDGFTDPPHPLGSSPWWFRPQQVIIRQDVT